MLNYGGNYGLLIPVRNEEKIMPQLLPVLLSLKHENNQQINGVFIIDDHSSDKTRDLILEVSKLDPWITLLTNQSANKGYGAAISSAISILKSKNQEWVVILDSDLSNSIQEAVKLVMYCKNLNPRSQIVLVKGNRFWEHKIHMEGVPLNRKLLSILANKVAKIFSLNVTPDPTNGFRAIHIPSYPLFESRQGFDSIVQELYEIKKARKKIGFYNTCLTANSALRNTTLFSYSINTFLAYLKWSFLIGTIQLRNLKNRFLTRL